MIKNDGGDKVPKKFIRCVRKVKAKRTAVNPYAVCRKSTGYYGTTHDIGLLKRKRRRR